MRLNENTIIKCQNFDLVPYKKHHVEKYHNWMKSTELQQLTASEPLSLEEEYKMQQSWHLDDDKLTFIILENNNYLKENKENVSETERMIGDVNIFFSIDYDKSTENKDFKIGECEIMIAEKSARGRGLAYSIISVMIKYCQDNELCDSFISRIGYENHASQHIFKKLGFVETSRAECFQEVTLTLQNFEDLRIPEFETCSYQS